MIKIIKTNKNYKINSILRNGNKIKTIEEIPTL
jgi:hypothetical protein